MGVMSSYNDWDGVPVTASYYFLTELLREEYGFDGYVVSDSEAVEYVQTKHHVADTYDEAVRQVLEAGLNVRTHFTKPVDFILPIRRLLEQKKISMATIDKRVAEVLRVKFRLGLFDHPYVEDTKASDKVGGVDRNMDFVKQIQQQSLILLKNEDNLLPLDRQKIRKVLVTGPLADESNFMESRYGPNRLEKVTVLDGLRAYLKGRAEVVYAKGCDIVDKGWPATEILPSPLTDEEKADMVEAVQKAGDCDVIIAVLGEDEYRTGESRSRTSLDLPGRQQQLLEALYATGKPVVLVLINVLFIPRFSYMACAWAGFAGYGTAMLLSYFVGQKKYPIRYDLKGIGRYVLLAAVLYVAAEYVPIENLWLRLGWRTVLLVVFAAYIVKHDLPLSRIPLLNRLVAKK